ncbi:hypothetical protein L226DRAFT_575060 [Lentinus tigrinus ALCF2SS1-7]|uniref:Uncharacterized protein n=1 Tax=Lentinus tigrinus ALCF2SS1-6 TaxID=1328759 RepID=A0A5C2RU72_9APHY|nr:hypothetical protein L227DRAFT_615539 [Lentinus tigrinus ALCF2SS1-6]RPD70158.1 hypothetical protein L226DRAFT_575060 [Lentinus tigrinus ALCF2SS1-7]
MSVPVDAKYLYVFDSLFKSRRGARCALTWHEFTCAMASAGFAYGPAGRGGASRKFEPVDEECKLSLRRHEPHDGKLTTVQQDRICSILKRSYGWHKSSFVARQPAPAAVARDAEGDAGGDAAGVAGDHGVEAQEE